MQAAAQRLARVAFLVCAIGWLSGPLRAQLAFQNAHILVGDGTEIERGSLLVRGDKIMAVSHSGRAPMMMRKFDLSGKFITPGLIDAWSTLGARVNTRAGRASGKAVENFDRYARADLEAALRQGVTAAYIPARAPSGIAGLGAVVRLLPGGELEQVVIKDKAALATVIASGAGPIARVKMVEAIERQWKDARDYREALETYDEDLEEYLKELKKWAAKKDENQPEKKDGENGEEENKDEQTQKKNADEQKRAARPPRRGGRGRGAKPAEKKPDKKADQDEKKDDRPTKPTKPQRDLNKETLLEVIDGQLVWRVEARRTADILNVLAIAQHYNLALVLEGSGAAARVAGQLAEQEVPVVLDAFVSPVAYTPGADRETDADALARLLEAGVEVYLGSGPVRADRSATPQLALRAAAAVGNGMDAQAALRAITHGAAELLGVSDQIGKLDSGMAADFVIWSDHPFAPGARVESVFIAGKEVYTYEPEARQQGGQ